MRRVQLARIVGLEKRGDRAPLVDRLAAEYIGAVPGICPGILPGSVVDRLFGQGRITRIYGDPGMMDGSPLERFHVLELDGAFVRRVD